MCGRPRYLGIDQTIRSIIPEPSTLLDIVEKGAEHEAYSTACLYEVIEQLKGQTKYPVLIAVGTMI